MNSAVEALEQRLHVTRHRGSTLDARCPAHDDRTASLTVSPGEHGGAVLHCHAGCEPKDVLAALDMSFADIAAEPRIVAIYEYRDEGGTLLWHTERWEPKTFRQRGLPAPAGRVLYHSEWLPQARAEGRTIYVVEGEKDADTLAKHGEIGVCGVNGAGSWLDHYAEQLVGMDVIVIADNDDPGKDHARHVVKSLDGKAARVSLMVASYGKDITDQLDAGYGLDTLVPLSLEPTLGVHRADHIREREITWLWPGYIPAGKLVMVDGDPGDGKSVLTCDLAARFSTGAALPDGTRSPLGAVDVAMISAEDDPADTIKPRLRVAGADLRRIHLITEGIVPEAPFSLGRDIGALEQLVTEHHIGLVVIDPLMAFMPEGVDAYRDAEVRRALHPLTRMAARTDCALVVVRHLTKGRTKAITAGGGSIAFIGAARVGYLVGPHPDDERKRVLAGVKVNIGPMPDPLGYEVVSSIPGDRFAPPTIRWDDEPLKLTAQEILSGGDDEERDARAEAREWLDVFLRANRIPQAWVDIARAGKKEGGHSEATLRRVRKAVAEMVRDPKGPDGFTRHGVYWVTNRPRHLSVVPAPVDTDTDDEGPTYAPTPKVESLAPAFHPATERLRPDACQVCGAAPAVWFVDVQAHRCAAHDPMAYGG